MKFSEFCKKKGVQPSLKTYFIDAMSAMALGLFASLLIGTIFTALGMIPGLSFFTKIGAFCGYGKEHSEVCGARPGRRHCLCAKSTSSGMLISLPAAVGCAANALGGGGGPLPI